MGYINRGKDICMRDKEQEFAKEPLFHLMEIISSKAKWGKKISLRSLNEIVFKLYLGWVIAGDLHRGNTSN